MGYNMGVNGGVFPIKSKYSLWRIQQIRILVNEKTTVLLDAKCCYWKHLFVAVNDLIAQEAISILLNCFLLT